MDASEGVAELRLVGGRLVLDFLNTRSGPPTGGWDTDAISRYDALVEWSVRTGELTAADAARLRTAAAREPAKAERALRGARDARDELDAVFRALSAGSEPPAPLVARLAENEARALSHARLDAAAGFSWSWAGDDSLLRPLHPVFHSAVELLASGRLERLKACQGCSYLFLDESKNRSRRWCSMSDCGTDTKMKRYVAARRARTAAS